MKDAHLPLKARWIDTGMDMISARILRAGDNMSGNCIAGGHDNHRSRMFVIGKVLPCPSSHSDHQVNIFGIFESVNNFRSNLRPRLIIPLGSIMGVLDEFDIIALDIVCQPIPQFNGLFALLRRNRIRRKPA